MKSIINNEDIVLSIGMIVKNEEKVLGRCLESLKPLRDKISCELIIADTGSTDNTMNIAQKYTENVFSFEWTGDFSAARNSTIEKAKGKWYFFLDADEYLDNDIEEIISFFSNPDIYMKCKTGTLMVRNYFNDEEMSYKDVFLPRFHRINAETKFVGKIHETILMRSPRVQFSTVLHHTGYFFDTGTEKKVKHERNEKIMLEEYEKDSENLRLLCHIIENYDEKNEYVIKAKYLKKALDIARKDANQNYRNPIYIQAALHYMKTVPTLTLELCEEYKKGIDYNNTVSSVSISMIKAITLMNEKKYDLAVETFNEYFSLYSDYKENKINMLDLTFYCIIGLTNDEFEKNVYYYLYCLYKLEKNQDLIEYIKKKNYAFVRDDIFKDCANLIRAVCIKNKNYNEFTSLLDRTCKTNENKLCCVSELITDTYFMIDDESERRKYSDSLVQYQIKTDFSSLLKETLYNNDTNELIYILNDYISGRKECFEEAVYYALKNTINITESISLLKAQEMNDICNKLISTHTDFSEVVANINISDVYFSDIKLFCWITKLYEAAALNSSDLSFEDKKIIYNNFVVYLCDYISNVYNHDLLNDDDISVLPIDHIFGYYMMKANEELLSGNRIKYIQYLKKALLSCEPMKDIIKFYIEQFQKSL